MVFLGWITFAQTLASTFNPEIYILTLLASFFGLVIGAHYIDIATSTEKFSPFFKIPAHRMLAIGFGAVAVGGMIGAYVALKWNIFFMAFVIFEVLAAVSYPREYPKFAHSYLSFGLTWGVVPFIAAYFIQEGAVTLLAVGVSIFVGLSVVMMHHLAIMSRESADWTNALYLLKLYRYSVYAVSALALVSKFVVF
jgi:hypothetical protein